jgi:hypothetical protein
VMRVAIAAARGWSGVARPYWRPRRIPIGAPAVEGRPGYWRSRVPRRCGRRWLEGSWGGRRYQSRCTARWDLAGGGRQGQRRWRLCGRGRGRWGWTDGALESWKGGRGFLARCSWRPLGFSGFVFSEWPNLLGVRWVDNSDFELLQSSGKNNRKGVKHCVANFLFIRVWIFSYLSLIWFYCPIHLEFWVLFSVKNSNKFSNNWVYGSTMQIH